MANIILNSIWSEWQVEKRLGGGTYGSVYKVVRRDQIESYAAVKVIHIPKDETDVDTLRSEGMRYEETETYFKNVVDDFVKEIELMLTFKGAQNIVSVEDYKVIKREKELGWDIYIRMELLNTLDDYFRDHYPDEREIIKMGIDICTALEKCSKRGVIHRDIKPDNILIDSFGDFKLGDFGIARTLGNASMSMTQAGTPNYLAPEITKSSRYDATVDLYSLGLVLYRYANDNRLPFIELGQNTSPSERQRALMRRFEGEPLVPPCNASKNLAEVILTACAYDPARRYKTPTEMKNALISIMNGTYVSTYMYDYFEVEQLAYDATRAVRPVEGAQEPYYAAPFDSTAGNGQSAIPPSRGLDLSRTPEYERQLRTIKKIKIAIAVCAVIGLLIIIFGVILPQLPKKDRDSNSSSASDVETIKYSASDEQKIAEIIKEAEVFASNDDYDSAYERIKTGLVTYPKSASLMEKESEYYNIRYKRDTLATAKVFADMDSLPEAITAIKDAQEKQGDCPEYQAALTEYIATYKSSVIEQADAAAANGDYISAIETLNDAVSVLGNDAELSVKKTAYENSYVSECVIIVNNYISSDDFYSATNHINKALDILPNNSRLLNLLDEVNNKKPIKLSDIGIGDYCNFKSYENSSINDTTGRKHSGENVYTINAKNDQSGYIRVYLGKEYSKVKGYIAMSENSPVGRPLAGNIKINLDNKEIKSYDVPNRAISPINFEVSVENTDWFEIEYNGSYFSLGYGYEAFEIVISDVYLYK